AMRKLTLPARLAHMVAKAGESGDALAAARLAVLVTERGLGGNSVDLDHRLARFASEKGPRAEAARGLARRLAGAAVDPRSGPSGHLAWASHLSRPSFGPPVRRGRGNA